MCSFSHYYRRISVARQRGEEKSALVHSPEEASEPMRLRTRLLLRAAAENFALQRSHPAHPPRMHLASDLTRYHRPSGNRLYTSSFRYDPDCSDWVAHQRCPC